MAKVNSSVLKERLKSKKMFLYLTVAATLVVDVLLTALLISGGLAFSQYGIFVFVVTVFDVGLLAAVVASNFKFKYSRTVPTIYVFVSAIIGGALTVIFNIRSFYFIAMIIFVVFRLISAIAVMLGTRNGANRGGGLKAVTCLFTVALLFVSGVYVTYAANNGIFGQGGFGYRAIHYEYVADGDYYVARPINQAKGEKVIIAKEFNGKKVTTVCEEFFCDDTIKEIYLQCGAKFSVLEDPRLGEINNDLKIFVDKNEIDDVKQAVIDMAADSAENDYESNYKERYMSIYNMIIPDGLADNEVFLTFDYSYEDIEQAKFKPITTWIGKKGEKFDLKKFIDHASGIFYVDGYDLSDEEFLKANHASGGKVLSPLRNSGEKEDIFDIEEINANMADIKIHFEKIFVVTIDETCNDTLYRIYDEDEFLKNGGNRYVLQSDPYNLLSGIQERTGFTIAGWEYKTKDSVMQRFSDDSHPLLADILKDEDVTVRPVWELNKPDIKPLKKDKESYVYGDDVTFTVDAVSPADGVKLSYEWSFNGAPVSDGTASTYTKTTINPKLDVGDQGTYTVKVTASSTTVTSLTSVSERSVELKIGKKTLHFKWELPDDATYTGLAQTVKASYVESDVINNDEITGEISVTTLATTTEGFKTTVKNAGTYKMEVKLTGDWNDLYKIDEQESNATARVTIKPCALTLTWSGYDGLVYDGNNKNVTATAQGIGDDGELALKITDGNKKDAGSYKAAAEITDSVLGKNYSIVNSTLDYTIAQREITLVWDVDNATFTYDKEGHCVQVKAIENAVSGEEGILSPLTMETLANTASTPKYTATAKIVNKNYTFAAGATKTCDFIINPKPVTISWANTKLTYNGTKQAPTATVNPSDLCGGDECNVTVDGKQTNAGDGYVATATELSNPNYIIAEGESTATCSFEIAKATLTPTVTDSDLTYNGSEQNAQIKLEGIFGDDECVATLSGETNKNAGVYTVTIESLNGEDANNYQLSTNQVGYTIKKAPLTLRAEDVDIVYGDELPTLSEISYVGFMQLEDETLFGNQQPTLKCSYERGNNAGDYKIEFTQSYYTLNNYEVTTESGLLTVAKRQITVSVDNKESVYGEAAEELTAKVTVGSVYNNEVPYELTCKVEKTSSAGEYTISAENVKNNNYEITFDNGTYTVKKKTLTIDWGSETEFTYEGLKAFKPTVDGAVNGDDVKFSVQYSGRSEVPTVAGTYTLSVTLYSAYAKNYEITENATFDITLVPQVPDVAE